MTECSLVVAAASCRRAAAARVGLYAMKSGGRSLPLARLVSTPRTGRGLEFDGGVIAHHGESNQGGGKGDSAAIRAAAQKSTNLWPMMNAPSLPGQDQALAAGFNRVGTRR